MDRNVRVRTKTWVFWRLGPATAQHEPPSQGLEWVCAKSPNCVWLFETPWTVACQAPLFLGFSREEYERGLPFLSPGDLPGPGVEPASFTSPALAGRFFTTRAPGKPCGSLYLVPQLCLILCDSMDCSSQGSPVHGILQARLLKRVTMPSSRGCSWHRDQTQVSCFAGGFFTLWATGLSPWYSIKIFQMRKQRTSGHVENLDWGWNYQDIKCSFSSSE